MKGLGTVPVRGESDAPGVPLQIVKQVRLSVRQRLTLMEMANNGGSASRMDWEVRTALRHLGLIEERSLFTAKQKAERLKARAADWKEIVRLAQHKDLGVLDRKVDNMRSAIREDEDKAWFLTPAAQEYLVTGTVTIRGPAMRAAARVAGAGQDSRTTPAREIA